MISHNLVVHAFSLLFVRRVQAKYDEPGRESAAVQKSSSSEIDRVQTHSCGQRSDTFTCFRGLSLWPSSSTSIDRYREIDFKMSARFERDEHSKQNDQLVLKIKMMAVKISRKCYLHAKTMMKQRKCKSKEKGRHKNKNKKITQLE